MKKYKADKLGTLTTIVHNIGKYTIKLKLKPRIYAFVIMIVLIAFAVFIISNITTDCNSNNIHPITNTNTTIVANKNTTYKVKVTASSLKVRTGTSTSCKCVGSLPKGKIITVYGKSNDWLKIKYNGNYRWIYSQYTKKVNSSNNSVSKSNATTKFKLNANDRNYIERVVAAEARGERYGKITGKYGTTYKGIAVIAQVIYDRAACKNNWSNTPYGVASSKNQFAKPYNGKISKEVKAAVSAVFDYNYRVTEKPLYYFCTTNCYPSWAKSKTYVMTLGNHKFYR